MRKALIVFACAILCSSFALAQSTESACDGEQGAAYGLCNAFCDAMDCDSDDPQASETACNKVKSKFQNITGRDVPCEEVICPCASLPDWSSIPELPSSEYCVAYEGGVSFGSPTGFTRIFVSSDPEIICGVRVGSATTLPITPEEAAVCTQLIIDIAASKNVACN